MSDVPNPALKGGITYAHSEVPIERNIALDMLKRGWPLFVVLVLAGFYWGSHGALSAAFGCLVVVVNLLASGVVLSVAARISPVALMGGVMIGFFLRLAVITVAVLVVRHQAWVSPTPLGLALVITHIGLFAWEARYVSSSLADPGLKPTKKVKQ